MPRVRSPTQIAIRPATALDVPLILELIRALAEYEKLSSEVVATEDLLERHLFGPTPRAEVRIAELDGQAVGFSLFFHNFSTFLAKPGIYLEDVFVRPAFRGRGVGRALLRDLAKIALQRDCARLEWAVLDWNEPALQFYQEIGAKPMSQWQLHRMTRPAIESLARSLEP